MKNGLKKVLSVLLVTVMLLTAAPLQGVVGIDFSEWFASIAEAALLENGYRQGFLGSFTTVYDFDLEYYIVSTVTIDGREYDLASNYQLKESDANDLKNVIVFFKLEDSKVVKLTSRLSSIKNNIRDPELVINYTNPDKKPEYKNGYWTDRKITLKSSIAHCSRTSDWEFNQFLQDNNFLELSDISLKYTLSENQSVFKFKNDKTTEIIKIDDVIGVINDGITSDVNVYIDKDYVVSDDVETFKTTIECELTADVNLGPVATPQRVSSTTKFEISVDNTGKKIAEQPMTMLELLDDMESMVYKAHNAEGYKEFKDSQGHTNLSNIKIAIQNIKALENFNLTKINFDAFEAISTVYGYAIKNPTSATFVNVLLDAIGNSIEDEVVKFEELKNTIKNDIIEQTDYFDSYVKWYCLQKYSQYNNYKTITIACPVNIEIMDAAGDAILSIVNDSVVYCDERVYAYVTEDSVKLVQLPADIDHIITITATDNGTMDYTVSEYTPGGIERSIKYEDVPLTVNESYEAVVPNELMLAADNYNLTSSLGEVVECDTDTLPPVEDNIVDVIVAEELFDGFPVEIIDLVANTMFNMESVVDLTAYDISTDDAVALFSAVAKYYPAEYSLIANSDFTYKIIVSPNLDRIMKIRFYYGDDANLSTYQKRVNDLNAEIDSLVAQVAGMNEFEKALYIHDYIVLHSEYDLELLEYMEANNFTLPGELRSEKYTEYSILVNGTGVCGSYALAYRAVLNAAGMECLYLSSREMNHAWNLVKIDGNWYHVDCCWDDPIPDTYGRARRTYFLRTDKEIMDLQHYSWSPGQYKATSELYSDMPRDYDIKQKYDDGKWYYLSGTSLFESDMYGNNETLLTSITASSIDADGGSVYYASGRYIYEYVKDSQETNFAYILSANDMGTKPANASLTNIYVDGNTVEFYKSVYNDEDKRITVFDSDTLQKEKLSSVTGITISPTEVSLNVFDTMQLSATIEKTEGILLDDVKIEWVSSDDTIVQVDKNGNITAANVGSATVEAHILNFIATCKITITGNGLAGTIGNNIRWIFEPVDGTLTFSGNGTILPVRQYCPSSIKNAIKSVIIEEGITGIGGGAFEDLYSLTSITIPDSVKTIHATAFIRCTSLTSVTIPNSVTSIQISTFLGCSALTSITIPDSVTSIGNSAFSSCDSLTSIIIPDSVTSIGNSAFSSCDSLASITIPDSVTSIGNSAFNYCYSLTIITVDEANANYSSDAYGVLFNKDKTTLIQYPIGNARTSYTIPNSVTSIGEDAFSYCTSLTSIAIPDSVTSIGGSAFSSCDSLTSIIIPDSVTSIGSSAFADCTSLISVTFGENSQLTSIGPVTFVNCTSLTSIAFPDGVTSIDILSFKDCVSLTSITIPDSVTFIWPYAFDNCFSLNHIGCCRESTSIGMEGNTYLLDAPYIHYNFDPDTDIITLDEKTATCTENGHTKGLYCIDCQCYLEGEVIEATGHSYSLTENVAGTCTTAPYEVYTCSACGDSYIKEGRIEDGHKLTVEVIAPTCDEKGYTKEICTVCGETMISEFTSPVGHSFIITRSADYCEAHGTITYECKNCDYTETIASDPADLVTETVIVEPACTKSGTKSEICTLCGATVATEILNPLSHAYAEEFTVDLEPTCTTTGRKSQHCTRCDAKRAVTEIEMLEHSAESLPGTSATCTGTGLTAGEKCTVCGTVTIEQTEIPVLGHAYKGVVTKEATCTAAGVKTFTCEHDASHTYTETIAKLAHKKVTVDKVDATATEDGYTGDVVCSVCGTEIEKGEIIPATGEENNNCDHLCHKTGIMGIFWKIIRFFWKLFGMNPACECGAAHY